MKASSKLEIEKKRDALREKVCRHEKLEREKQRRRPHKKCADTK
jgi:hypothetical protein